MDRCGERRKLRFMTDCLICHLALEHEDHGVCTCVRCGHYEFISNGAHTNVATLLKDPGPQLRRRGNLSHKVRRRTRKGQSQVLVPLAELERWGLDDPPPSPAELLDQLILWVGDNQPTPELFAAANKHELAAWLGLSLPAGDPMDPTGWLLREPNTGRFIDRIERAPLRVELQLNWAGWERYATLRRHEDSSFTAFMAMKFGYADLDAALEDHFKPAVQATGFTLRRVTDAQGAGSIDDQMRVGLRTCRFVISDLTHASRGAYWEAGFGEGLGKPVIYTCREDHWKEEGTHFDTNHLVTVVWNPAKMDEAMAQLKATIRATLPDVAKMTDEVLPA